MTGSGRGAPGFVISLACALAGLAVPVRAAIPCPDTATVRAARLIEFQAMMMDVSVRCNHVGVALGTPLSDMSTVQAATFRDAHNKVRAYLLAARAGLGEPVTPSAKGGAKGGAAPSRRTDPLDRYITMAGNRYGGGSTTPDRCRAFEAIALSLAEPGSGGKLLTTVADSLIAQTILEKITSCAAKP